MKTLQLTTHLNIGGIPNYILNLSKSLKERGVEIVAASSGGELVGEFEKYGISHRVINIRTKSELSPKILISVIKVRSIVKEERINIIHAHTRVSQVVAYFVSRLTGIPYVTTCHGYFKKRFRKIFDTWGSKVIAISEPVARHLETDLDVAKERIELVHSGIDVKRFAKIYSDAEIGEIKRSLALPAGPLIGTIGRLSSIKGQRHLIDAMKKVLESHTDAQLLIVGDGPEEVNLKSQAKSLGIEGRISFLRSHLDVNKLLSVMDIFVLPSIKEGLGIALLEALATGRACIASDVGGIADIIENGSTGLLVEPADFKGMAEKITTLLENSDLRKEMGDKGRAFVREKFSLDLMTDKIEHLYEEVLKG